MTDYEHKEDHALALAPTARALTFDAAAYVHFLKDTDWTESQKREFTEALWQIVVGFVDLGFGLNAIQQMTTNESLLETDSPAMLDSMNASKSNNQEDTTVAVALFVQETDS